MTAARILAVLAVGLAAPAAAQAPSCGGIGVVGAWIGGEEAGSDLATADGTLQADGQVPIAGHLVRLFALSEPTTIQADVAAVPSGDPYAAIYDASGAEVATDDDSGGQLAARIVADLAAGRYCLAARSYEAGVTDVTVRIGRADAELPPAPPPPVSPTEAEAAPTGGCDALDVARLGDGPLDGAALAEGISATAPASERPAYLFELAEPMPVTLTAAGQAADPLIRLRDGAGAVVAENDDADGLDARIDQATPLPAGRYCVEVEDLNGGDAAVTVGLKTFDALSDRLRRIGTLEIAPTGTDPVAVSDLGVLDTALTASMEAGATARWFAFDLPTGGLVLAEAVSIGGTADPVATLFDRVGRVVATSDDGPQGLDSLIVHRAVPGRYLVGLRTYAEGPGEVRLLLERFVPAR